MPAPVIVRLLVVLLLFAHLTGCAAIVAVADAAIPDAEEKKSVPSK